MQVAVGDIVSLLGSNDLRARVRGVASNSIRMEVCHGQEDAGMIIRALRDREGVWRTVPGDKKVIIEGGEGV